MTPPIPDGVIFHFWPLNRGDLGRRVQNGSNIADAPALPQPSPLARLRHLQRQPGLTVTVPVVSP
jgi:hypothetical protein